MFIVTVIIADGDQDNILKRNHPRTTPGKVWLSGSREEYQNVKNLTNDNG